MGRTMRENQNIGEKIVDEIIRGRWDYPDRVKRFLDLTDRHIIGEAFCASYDAGDIHALIDEIDAYAAGIGMVDQWNAIASYMTDEIREDVHADLAPCTDEEFLREYLNRDPDFYTLLRNEFPKAYAQIAY